MIQDLEEVQVEHGLAPAEAIVTAEAGGAEKRVTFIDVLRAADFRNLWLGQIVSQVGDYFAFLAMTVVVSGLSQDAQATTLAVSGMMLSFTLPRLLLGMLAGVFVDRWDRRRTMLVSDISRAGITLLLIPAFISGNLWFIYGLAFIMSSMGTLFNPAKGALIPRLVPDEQLLAANSLSQTSQMLAVLGGPALAGLTLKVAGTGNEWVAFIVDSASFVISAFTIWLIRTSGRPTEVAQRAHSGLEPLHSQGPALGQVWRELKEGLRTLVVSRVMASLSTVFAITMLGVGAINVLWVVFLKTHFGFDGPELAWRLSLLDIAFAAGMIVSSVIAGNFFSSTSPKWYIVVSLIGAGVPIVIFGYVPNYWLAFILSALMGFFVAPIDTGVTTFMQIVVPNRLLGRVGGGFTTVSDTASVASMSLAGVAGALLGIPTVFALAGVLCIAMGTASWMLLPALTLKDKVE